MQRKRIPRDHAKILAAIEHKDSAQARRLIASHIDTAFEDLVSLALPATVIGAKQAV
jgi:DNA-binding GntR family transcriptional regulator